MTMVGLFKVSRAGDCQEYIRKICLILSVLIFNCVLNVNCTSDCVGSHGNVDNILKPLKPLEGRKFEVILKNDKEEPKGHFKVGICCKVDDKGDVSVQMQEDNVNFGTYKTSSVFSGKNFIQLVYGSTEGPVNCNKTDVSAKIIFTCDPERVAGDMQVLENFQDHYLCSYTFQLGTKYACTGQEGLSSGSIFCILFFTGVSLYLLLGFLYQRLLVGAKGLEQIPNYSFWRDFGNLQADGCDFICRCGPRQEAQSYRGIDERLPRDEERDDQLLNM